MSLHQVIYTSCMRGINGVNDGQQIFSYDAAFDDANNDEVKSLFSYQPPILDPGVIMTEEIAQTLPQSFIYRKVEDHTCALALNTYLGRDYMGSAGRFGNHLSHVILASENEIQDYPCEFYNTPSLRDKMKFEEVNNPDRPDFLPTPQLEKGFTVDIDTVFEFLSIEGRMEVFKNMLCAALSFNTERKRVVICDEPENIIMWIAAIEYTLPLKTALNINFSTYDFDPSLSASQICGVIPKGSRFNADSHRVHFAFDLYQNICAEFEKDENYFSFIDTAMSLSYDSLQDFHRFLAEGYDYDKADEGMYAAYRLYSITSDGIYGMNEKELSEALDFADRYANAAEHLRIMKALFEQKGSMMSADTGVFKRIMKYIVSRYDDFPETYRFAIKTLIVDKVLYEYLNNKSGEKSFIAFYDELNELCLEGGFCIATELMSKNSREKLFAVMQNDIETWKIAFIVKVVTDFVINQQIPVSDLTIDRPLGQTYYGLVYGVYSKNIQNGFYLVTCILDEFADDCKYLTNMAINVENMLVNINIGDQDIDRMWKHYGKIMSKQHPSEFDTAYRIFEVSDKPKQIYLLYSLEMDNAEDLEDAQSIFNHHFEKYVERSKSYSQQYGEKIITDYYKTIRDDDDEKVYKVKTDLFKLISSAKMNVSFAKSLTEEIVKKIPMGKPDRKEENLVKEALGYICGTLNLPVTGKFQLLVIGIAIDNYENIRELRKGLGDLEQLISYDKVNLGRVAERSLEDYFDWIIPRICELAEKAEDIERAYNLFDMPDEVAALFFAYCTKIFIKQSKGDDNGMLCEFMGVVFENGNAQIREDVGKTLCKLGKQKLAELDEDIKKMYEGERSALNHWKEIKKIAESTNPILNNLSNLFKRK